MPALAPGSRLGPYEIVAPLGAGGMGEVYRARDSRLGREVAIKGLPARDVTLVWSLEAPMLEASVHALFREVRVESGLVPASAVR